MNSLEYSKLGRSNGQFLGGMYDAVLRRYPDVAGWNGWLAYVNSGATRQQVIQGFVDSPEFTNRTNLIYSQGCI